jgi:cobalamin biosynthesis protein CobD/CbiB
MSEHRCHALGCQKPVPARMFMCLAHWRLVPAALKAEVWRTYRRGQEIRKDPSAEYLEAAAAAIAAVRESEERAR